jgi:tetratricopeptide (TPR) repeat protein
VTAELTENNAGRALYQQGLESDPAKSAELFSQAVAAFRRALAVSLREQLPQQWAQTQNNLGQALKEQGTRSEAAELLAQAVAAYRSALEVYTRDQLPQQWAMTQNNLGTALNNMGVLNRGQGRPEEARKEYEEALQIGRERLYGLGVCKLRI